MTYFYFVALLFGFIVSSLRLSLLSGFLIFLELYRISYSFVYFFNFVYHVLRKPLPGILDLPSSVTLYAL